jgi:MerR family mercuric resistance operon transcriptional regulator
MSESLTIGTLAKHGGVNVETIRYYQRRGLLDEPSKTRQGFRRYQQESVKCIRFIKRAQNLKFTLEEIQSLLDLEERKACQETRSLAADKLALIEGKIANLSRMKKALSRLVRACDTSSVDTSCPIIQLLTDD